MLIKSLVKSLCLAPVFSLIPDTSTGPQIVSTLREVNSAGTVTYGGLVVDGVNIGIAVAAYTTMDAAHTAAAASGDTIVASEAFADSTAVAFTKTVTVNVADGARSAGTVVADGYRLTSGCTINSTLAFIYNVRFHTTSGTTGFLHNSKVGGSMVLMDACSFYKDGLFQAAATLGDAGGTGDLTIRNSLFYLNTSATGVAGNGAGTTVTLENCTAYGISGGYGFRNVNAGTFTCNNCVSIGTWSSTAYGGTLAGDYNVASDTSAPGGNSTQSVSAATYFKVTTGGSEDAHCTSSTVMDDYAGTDLSGSFTKDFDGDTRAAWYAGADYVAA